jgi:hypothetical protein
VTATQVHRSIDGGVRWGLASTLATLMALLCTAAGAAGAVSPLPASDYAVLPACGPPAPGSAGCLALQLVPETAAALAHTHPLGMTRSAQPKALSPAEGDYGLRPQDLKSGYFPNEQPDAPTTEPQTIALVDAYDDPHAEADLATFDKEFGLPACTEADGCFRKVNQTGGKTPLPSSSGAEAKGWAIEISTDVEAAHSVCQNCHIVLIEANSALFSDLEEAEATAGKSVAVGGVGATEISDSWGGAERGVIVEEDSNSAFNQPGVVIAAAAGDDGYLDWGAENSEEHEFPDYPASSPHVVAVGGTRLTLSEVGGTWENETVWNGDGATGGGCSTVFTAQPWQQATSGWSTVGCVENHRAVADVSADGDPYSGIAVYDSIAVEGRVGWGTVGGTSLASPIVASMFALVGGAHKVPYPAQTLYENLAVSNASFHDVVSGSNGACGKPFNTATGISECDLAEEDASCSASLICRAGPGYDGPSGVGSPDGIAAFRPGGGQEDKQQAEEKRAEEKRAEEKRAEEKRQAEEETREQEKEAEEKRDAGSGGGDLESGSGGTGSGSGSSSGQPGAGGGTAGGASGTSTSGTSAGGGSGTSATPTSSAANEPIPVLSELSLTRTAIAALSHARPKALQLAFAFTLSAPARVRVTVAKQVRVRGRTRWQTLPDTIAIAAAKGRDGGRLSGHGALAPGRYRLTLTPARGIARTLTFQVD